MLCFNGLFCEGLGVCVCTANLEQAGMMWILDWNLISFSPMGSVNLKLIGLESLQTCMENALMSRAACLFSWWI